MAVDLRPIISRVRSTLSDVPREFLTDKQIMIELEKAQAFCDAILVEGTTDNFTAMCYEVVSAYYAYINYTTLSERQLGTLPPTSKIRLDALRRTAVSFLQLASSYPIDENMLIDKDTLRESYCAGIELTTTVLDDD